MFVLDEADEMLSRGFKDQIYEIFQKLSSNIQVKAATNRRAFWTKEQSGGPAFLWRQRLMVFGYVLLTG